MGMCRHFVGVSTQWGTFIKKHCMDPVLFRTFVVQDGGGGLLPSPLCCFSDPKSLRGAQEQITAPHCCFVPEELVQEEALSPQALLNEVPWWKLIPTKWCHVPGTDSGTQ